MTALCISDTHWTDRAQDEHRWGLFGWLRDTARDTAVTEIIHCGDMVDAKDRHAGKLVNRLIDELVKIAEVARVVIIAGNHDGLDPASPFFAFLREVEGITYIAKPTVLKLSIGRALFVPAGAWGTINVDVPYVFTHVTFDGSEAENGRLLPGVDPGEVASFKGKIFSGDIHVPQKIGKRIEYIGAPYHIKFGDRFEPRALLIADNGKTTDLHYPTLRKHVVDIDRPDELLKQKIKKGDQVKVRCYLRRSDYVTWREIRQQIREIATDKGWHLFGPELLPLAVREKKKADAPVAAAPTELLEAYAKQQHADKQHLDIGRKLLTEVLDAHS